VRGRLSIVQINPPNEQKSLVASYTNPRPVWGGALHHIPDCPADGTLLREKNGTIGVIFSG
jgi:hypothetical protein